MAQTISKDGTKIGYTKTGKGHPVIVADGALCSRAFGPTKNLVPLLEQYFTVITYDRRGRNESGDTAPYSVQREIEDIDALITEAGGSAYAVGFSSGAALVLNAAAAGLNINKILLYEPPYVMNQGGHNPPAECEAKLRQILATGERGKAVNFFMVDMVGMPAIFSYIMRLMPVWSKLKAVAHTLPYDAAVMGDYNIPVKAAANINIPAMVMGGGKSPIALKNAVKKTAAAIPGSMYGTLPGQTHNVSMKAIAPEIIKFFNS